MRRKRAEQAMLRSMAQRRLKRRNVVRFRRRLKRNISRYQQGDLSFAELDAGVQGWINHVRYGDTWGLRQHLLHDHLL